MSKTRTDGTYLKNFASPSKNSAMNKEQTEKEWQLQSVLRYTQTQKTELNLFYIELFLKLFYLA